jgi:FixJ family two-component response regulator
MSLTGEVVYLVDDDPSVREALSELFSSLGIEHVTFGSASEYLSFVRSDRCACLVLDVQMPEINGLDLQQQLGSESGPPIIFITGRADIPSTVRAMKAGASEFLTKPVDSQSLLAAIRSAFIKDLEQRQKTAELMELRRRFALLTPREREVLPLVVSGMLNKQAAAVLRITDVTLQVHRGQIMKKMEANSFADLVRMAERLGIPSPGRML